MPTAIRTPVDLPLPMVAGYGSTIEESRSRVEMDVGRPRTRRKTRTVAKQFEIQWDLDRFQYQSFDIWWQYIIKGGALEFDMQLEDDDGSIVWYTCIWLGEYKAEVIDGLAWRVTAKARTISEPFEIRPAGTDDLHGLSKMALSGQGQLLVLKVLRGTATMEFVGKATLGAIPMYASAQMQITGKGYARARPYWGSAVMEILNTGRLINLGDPFLLLQFDAVTYTEPSGDSVELQFDNVFYIPPSVALGGY